MTVLHNLCRDYHEVTTKFENFLKITKFYVNFTSFVPKKKVEQCSKSFVVWKKSQKVHKVNKHIFKIIRKNHPKFFFLKNSKTSFFFFEKVLKIWKLCKNLRKNSKTHIRTYNKKQKSKTIIKKVFQKKGKKSKKAPKKSWRSCKNNKVEKMKNFFLKIPKMVQNSEEKLKNEGRKCEL